MQFPQTETEYRTLLDQGQTVVYAETAGQDAPPAEPGWHYWSNRVVDGEIKAVWRKIVTFENAEKMAE